MVRWPEGARRRLADAALDLFVERGFSATTVDDVAAAAGVTQRTFFRHFGDKEEVLFAEDDELLAVLLSGVAGGRGEDVGADLRTALGGLATFLEPGREHLRRRAAVIATDVGLTGRDLAKQARWTATVAAGLREKGYPPPRADLMAEVGAAVFRRAMADWLAVDDGPGLPHRVDAALAELAAAFEDGGAPRG